VTEGLRRQIEALVARLFKQHKAEIDAMVPALVDQAMKGEIDARIEECLTEAIAELDRQIDVIDGGA
jgi:predicted RecB family endonuclease